MLFFTCVLTYVRVLVDYIYIHDVHVAIIRTWDKPQTRQTFLLHLTTHILLDLVIIGRVNNLYNYVDSNWDGTISNQSH